MAAKVGARELRGGLPANPRLLESDLERFARFGIGLDLLAAACICRVTDGEAREVWGFRYSPRSDLSGIVFPYFDPVSGHRVTARLRRDRPEVDSEGKPQNKYLSAYGDNRHLYFPPGAGGLLKDVAVPVLFTESEKASLAFTALGQRAGRKFLCVATGGCSSWRGKIGIRPTPDGGREEERGPLPDLGLITCGEGRPAIVVFDSNTATNPSVRAARWTFAQVLMGLGARVSFADIPAEPDVNGPDDLIAVSGDGAMLALLDAAKPFADQAEKDAEELVSRLSKSTSLKDRDRAIEMISLLADVSHQRVLAGRAAKALKERKDFVEREVGLRAKAALEARQRAVELVRLGRLLRTKVGPVTLIAKLEDFYRERLALPEGATLVLALFTINSYVFDVFDTTPYIQIDSATGGCGKTTLLLHLEATCCRAYLGCDPTEATLYRRIERDHPTWLLDEASVLRGHEDRALMIRAVLDAGYRKGATVSRCVGEDNDLRDFHVYCPKAFALIGSLRGTVLDRCIVLHLEKTHGLSKTKLRLLGRLGPPLREKLEAYAAQFRDELQNLYDTEPDGGYWSQLDGREEELWGPLLFHAKLAGSDTEKRALAIAQRFSRQKAELAVEVDRTAALATELLEVLSEQESDTFSPGELLSGLAQKEVWGEKLASCQTDKARVVAIGSFLRNFRLQSRTREKHGTRYDRREACEVIGRHTPATDTRHATEPANMRVPGVATGGNRDATQNAPQQVETATVGGPDTLVATPAEPVATLKSRINTSRVARGNSQEGGAQGVLKY